MRRTWVKLYVETLRSSMISELSPEQRWMFVGLLLMAGDSPTPGIIFARKDENGNLIGYPDAILAFKLGVHESAIQPGLQRMVEKSKVTIDERGVISICNWRKYQSEYERTRHAPSRVVQKYGVDVDVDVDVDVEGDVEDKKTSQPRHKIRLILNENPKRWDGITDDDKALWAKTYPGCDIDATLQEMIAYWDAQPASKRKVDWKRAIVNRLKWLQDHGGTNRASGRSRNDFEADIDRIKIGREKP